VFVRPSLSEGFGNSFVEALSCGVPIIGTPVGGIPDFLVDRKTGLFCKVRNPEDLADKIELLLKNKKLASAIVKNGQKMVKQRYEWSSVAGQFDEVFQ
jgi:glycosyltransferase involved in cell wall biosynthesis